MGSNLSIRPIRCSSARGPNRKAMRRTNTRQTRWNAVICTAGFCIAGASSCGWLLRIKKVDTDNTITINANAQRGVKIA